MVKATGSAPKSDGGILGTIMGLFSSLAGAGDISRDKKRQLKNIRKELKKRSRFFNVKGDMAQPGMAKWFHDIYRVIGPAEILLEKYGGSELLKTVLIESFLNEEVRTLVAGLHPDQIKAKAEKSANIKSIAEEVKEALVRLYSALDANTVRKINKLYNDLHRLQAFTQFPFYFLLKKFDSMLPDRDFIYNPRFESINAQYIKDDLVDFMDVYYALDADADWDQLFDILRAYRDMDVVSRNAWKKLMQGRKDMMKSGMLEMIVRHLDEDPSWTVIPESTNYEIVEGYFNRIKTGAELTIQDVLRGRRKKQIDNLLVKLFGTSSISRMQYYTERENLTYHKKMLSGFTFVDPMNCLKAFFLDYYKSKVRVLVDLLLIQGKWSTKISSQQFSEAYHQLLDLSDKLLEFDASLSDEGAVGSKLKRLLRQSARDRSALVSMKAALQDVNGNARKIINVSAQNLISLGKSIKQILDEYKAQGQEIIINWKEVESWAERPVENQLTEVYTQIYYFIQLLQLYMKGK